MLYETVRPDLNQWIPQETVWVVDRNKKPLVSGRYYDGTFGGYSASGQVAPVYLVTEDDVYQWGTLTDRSINTGAYAWTQDSPTAGGGWVPTPNGTTATFSSNPAYEADSANIAIGTRVQFWMTDVADPAGTCKEWRFIQGCPSGSGSGSGGGGEGGANCSGVTLPTTIYATITDLGGLACLDGIVLPLTWNGNTYTGFINDACGGQNLSITIGTLVMGADFGTDSLLDLSCGNSNYIASQALDPVRNCRPLLLTVTMAADVAGGCGTGKVMVTITR